MDGYGAACLVIFIFACLIAWAALTNDKNSRG